MCWSRPVVTTVRAGCVESCNSGAKPSLCRRAMLWLSRYRTLRNARPVSPQTISALLITTHCLIRFPDGHCFRTRCDYCHCADPWCHPLGGRHFCRVYGCAFVDGGHWWCDCGGDDFFSHEKFRGVLRRGHESVFLQDRLDPPTDRRVGQPCRDGTTRWTVGLGRPTGRNSKPFCCVGHPNGGGR